MEHSEYWTPGVINTGDIVFVKKVNSINDIVTYVQGRETGYSTYGEYGNVILYKNPQGTIIIHRAIMYIKWIDGRLSINNYSNQSWLNVYGDCIVIKDVGFTHRNFSINVSMLFGQNGFITMGDNNLGSPNVICNPKYQSYEAADQTIFNYPPVNLSRIVGVAFGQVPWIGLIKLNILGLEHKWPDSADVAKNSYLYLILSLTLIFVAALLPYDKITRKLKYLKK
jgi:signal peptidase